MKKKSKSIFISFYLVLYILVALGGNYRQPSLSSPKIAAPGDVWFGSVTNKKVGDIFETQIYVDTGLQKIAIYYIYIGYNQSVIVVDTSFGTSGVAPGVDGFLTSVDTSTPEVIAISGFDVMGRGPGSQLHLLTIKWIAVALGTSPLNITIDTLLDDTAVEIGTPTGINGSVVVEEYMGEGVVWFGSVTNKKVGDIFETQIYVNTGYQKIATYLIDITYNQSVIVVDTSFGTSGVAPGVDGFLTSVDVSTPGVFEIFGVDLAGKGPGSQLHLLTIKWIAEAEGISLLNLTIDTLLDDSYAVIGIPTDIDEFIVVEGILGDVNDDGYIDLIDALLVAQHYVGLISEPPIDPSAGDVNDDGLTDIFDALLIAQYDAGLIIDWPPFGITIWGGGGAGGDVWFSVVPDKAIGDIFETQVYIDSGTLEVGVYGIDISFDQNVIQVETSVGINGVEAGADGFVTAVNATTPGLLRISGFDTEEKVPGSQLHLLTITWSAVDIGSSPLNITINTLIDESYQIIGTPQDIDGSIDVTEPIPPLVTINVPNNNTYHSNPPTIQVTIFDLSEINDTWYTILGSDENITFSGDSFDFDDDLWNDQDEGLVLIRIFANDSMGNLGRTDLEVIKDSIQPSIGVISPLDEEIFGEDAPEFNITVSDLHLDILYYTINNSTIKYYVSFTSGSNLIAINESAWDELPEGDIIIRFYINDTAGNTNSIGVPLKKQFPSEDPVIPGNNIYICLIIGTIVIILLFFRKKKYYKYHI
ncbi:MAG: dockerin type I domain-containing protein [Promethearchaeota archaeon]